MRVYDASMKIRPGMVVWPGEPEVEIEPLSRISRSGGANVSLLKMASHVGTHIDPPLHFIQGGMTVDQLPLDVLIGECLVCDVGDVHAIDIPILEARGITDDAERILFKTRNSGFRNESVFRTDFTYLEPDAARWLVDRGIRLVGIDYLSVEKYKAPGHPTHMALLGAGVVVVEGLDLSQVAGGDYTLVCLPLRIEGGDGSPARAVLIRDDA